MIHVDYKRNIRQDEHTNLKQLCLQHVYPGIQVDAAQILIFKHDAQMISIDYILHTLLDAINVGGIRIKVTEIMSR